jgi:hypothetical protein
MSAGSTRSHRRPKKFVQDRDVPEWHGRYEPYDLVKEVLVAFVAVVILVTGLAVVFGSPDDKPVTVKSWSSADPVDFAQTAITELDGSSGTVQPQRHLAVNRGILTGEVDWRPPPDQHS